MRTTVAILLAAMGCGACHTQGPVLVGPPDVTGDAGDVCHLACFKLEQNRCGTIAEPGCTDNCERDQALGVATQLDPAAVIRATTLPALSDFAGVPCLGPADSSN